MGHHIGIDVSKKALNCFVLETKESRRFVNDEAGIREMVDWLKGLEGSS
jgi:hypothetical protein